MPQGNFDVIFRAVTDTSSAKAEFTKLLNEFAGSEAEFRTKVVGDQKSLNDFIDSINKLAAKNKVELNFDHSSLKAAQDAVVDLQTKINNIDFKNVEKQFKKLPNDSLFKIDDSFIKEGVKNARKEFDKLYRTEQNKKNLTLNTSTWGSYDKKSGETISVDEKRFGKQIAEWDRYYKRLQDRVSAIRNDINSGAINKYSVDQLNDTYKKILEIQALQAKVEEWNPWMKDGDSGKKRRYDLSSLMMEPGKFKNVSAELLNSLSPISEKLGMELKSSLEEAEAAVKGGTDSLLSSLNYVFQKIGPISVEVVPEVDTKEAKKKIEAGLNGENIEVKVKVKPEPVGEDGLTEDQLRQKEDAEKFINSRRTTLKSLVEFNKSGNGKEKAKLLRMFRDLETFADATEMPSEDDFIQYAKGLSRAKPYFGIFEEEKPAEVKIEPKVEPGSVQKEVEKDSKTKKPEVKVDPVVTGKDTSKPTKDGQHVTLVPDISGFKDKSDEELSKISLDKKVSLIPDVEGFNANTEKVIDDLTDLQNRIKSAGLNTINLTVKADKNYTKYLSKFDSVDAISSSMSDSLIDEFNITDKNAKSQIKSLVESLRTIKTQEIVTGEESVEFMRTFEMLGNVVASNAQEFSEATSAFSSFYEAFKRAGSIKISDSIISNLGEEWNELRKAYPNKFTVNSGIEINSVYGQWHDQFQGVLPDVSDPTEQFKALVDAVREARKEIDTLHKVNPDEDFMENMYASITERMYNMQNALSNFVSNPQLENEIAQFNRLGDSIKAVEAAIESKNKAIAQEVGLVSSKIPEETGEFSGLKSVIDNIDFNKAFADVNVDAGKLNIGVEPRVNVTEFEALAQAQLGDASVSIGLSPTINPTEFTTLVESQLGKVKPTLTIPAANIDFSGIQNESSNLDEVAQKLKLIIDRIREKNELFKLEGKIVGKTVPNETKRLGQMASVLRDIERSLKTISFVLQTTDFSKIKLSNSQSSKKKSGSSSNNSNSNIQKVVGAYKGLISTEEQYQKLQYDVQQNRLGENVDKKKKQLEDLRKKREEYNNTIEETLKLEKDLDKNAAIADQKSKYDTKASEVEASMGQYRKSNSYIASVERFISNASKGDLSGSQAKALEDIEKKLAEIKKYSTNGIINSDADIAEINKLQQEIEELYRQVSNKKLDPVSEKEIAKLRSIITSFASTNTAAKEYIPLLEEILKRLDAKNIDRTIFDKASADFYELRAAINNTGKSGLSILDKWKKRVENVALYFASFASIYDVLNKLRQGFEIIVQYDDSLTEMKKVSDETMATLKDFQQASFNLGNTVGTTGSQIQASTADFMRLGESLEDAAQSALDANTLFKVSEFGTIEEATEALISMSQAYQELEKSEINDIMNYVGNNFAISTEGLATGLQKSAAALKTAGNDIYEAVALITAGNTIIQDADQVGAGIRTISLRILGTETAKDELAALGEDVDDFVVQTQSKIDKTVREYTAVASNNFKGISLLDDNGNYRSTYDILQDIADIYQEILEADKKAGTNRGSALVELLAGKNRSNIAASILQNPQILRNVYEQAQTESAGSAQKELEAQLESISSHLAKLKNQWESIWITDYNREAINFVLDRLTDILSVVEAIGVVPIGTTLAGIFAFGKNFDRSEKGLRKIA